MLAVPSWVLTSYWRPTFLVVLVLATLPMLLKVTTAGAEDLEPSQPWEFHSSWGWHEGDRVEYYDLGRASNFTAPAYRLVDDSGDPIEGQFLIVTDLRSGVLVGATPSANYSDFHRIWDVEVPPGYVPNTYTSHAELVAAGLDMKERDIVWNTPMVPEGSTLVGSEVEDHPLVQCWWRGHAVWYFRFGSSRDIPGLFDVASGLVRDGRAIAVYDPPGQLDILEDYPGDATYSPLTRLFTFNPISTEYIADAVRSVEEVEERDEPVFPEGNLYNRPVIGGRESYPRFDHAPSDTYELLEAWYSPTSKVLYYDMGPMLDGVASIYRFVTKEGVPIIGQHPLVETVAPGILLGEVDTSDYSTLWRVHDVEIVDLSSFEIDVIKSMDDVRTLGLSVRPTDTYWVAPMVTKGAVFLPVPSNPPGDVIRPWYNGAAVYLVDMGDNMFDQGTSGGGDVSLRTTNLTVIMDPAGEPYPNERPILGTLVDDGNYSSVWSLVEAHSGEGYRPGRFRTREQMEERGWAFRETGERSLGGFVAGPINVPTWRPETFTFVVGPVRNEDGQVLEGADVRVVRDIASVTGRTGPDGKVEFEVDHTWNGETVQCFVSKDGYDSIQIAAELEDYEFFTPLGGYVPPMVRTDSGTSIESATTIAIMGIVVLVLGVLALLARGRGGRETSITEAEADEIFSEGPSAGSDEGRNEGTEGSPPSP